MADHDAVCECVFCRNNHEFALGEDLARELLAGNVTIFAGAGVSTESRTVLKHTFYESIAAELGDSSRSLPFPELMEEYCRQPNGRIKLLEAIRERLDHIDSFPELARNATQFHRELGTFFPVKNIITTNWDAYFERFCGATPFVSDPDLAFWEAADRRVLKIHGSITSLGSIVATTGDYEACQKRLESGIIGGLLKTILATQTTVFVGYSLSDSDFAAVYGFVKEQMQSFHRQAYVVTPSSEECEKFAREGLIPIRTDGAFFFNQVKAHALSQGIMLDDEIYSAASELLDVVAKEHDLLCSEVTMTEHPEVIFAASYQDGMMHALERTIEMRGTGEYSHPCRIRRKVEAYLGIQRDKLRRRKYDDVAYVEGYINALIYLLIPSDERAEAAEIPLYFMFGVKADIRDLSGFRDQLARHPLAHKAAHKYALRCAKSLQDPGSVVFHLFPLAVNGWHLGEAALKLVPARPFRTLFCCLFR